MIYKQQKKILKEMKKSQVSRGESKVNSIISKLK